MSATLDGSNDPGRSVKTLRCRRLQGHYDERCRQPEKRRATSACWSRKARPPPLLKNAVRACSLLNQPARLGAQDTPLRLPKSFSPSGLLGDLAAPAVDEAAQMPPVSASEESIPCAACASTWPRDNGDDGAVYYFCGGPPHRYVNG